MQSPSLGIQTNLPAAMDSIKPYVIYPGDTAPHSWVTSYRGTWVDGMRYDCYPMDANQPIVAWKSVTTYENGLVHVHQEEGTSASNPDQIEDWYFDSKGLLKIVDSREVGIPFTPPLVFMRQN